jgi:hypothetical protein
VFGILAAVAYGIGYIEQGSSGHTNAWFSPMALLLAGSFFLALHLMGSGPGVPSWLSRR